MEMPCEKPKKHFSRLILVSLRKLIEVLQDTADRIEAYLGAAKEDTRDIMDRTIDRTYSITEKIELTNFIKLLTFLMVVLSFITMFISGETLPRVVLISEEVDFTVIILSFLLLIANIFYFAWQTLLVFQYRNFPLADDSRLPTCAVIVPAYNEGKHIAETLESILKSDYPESKLEIIAVNDGSRDDTWYWMREAAEKSNGRIRTINLKKNGGKRNALYQGFTTATSEIVVTIDSDSIVLPDTLRQIVSPFLTDPKIGGVAGNIRVLNLDEGIIPKMLDVSFVFGFEFLRSAQSVIRSVLCTPGALSAYRRAAIMPHMDEWVHQMFMGTPANIGEDRAITNILIREGYGIVFQKDAVVFTVVPVTYKGLCKMLIRWGRSNVRENLAMCRFTFRRIDLEDEDLLGLQINLVIQAIWMITPILFLGTTIYCLFVDAMTFIYSVLMVIIIWSTLPAFVYASRYDKTESLWSYIYGIFNFLTLSWIGPYSVFTVHRSGWLTRDLPKTASPSSPSSPASSSSPEEKEAQSGNGSDDGQKAVFPSSAGTPPTEALSASAAILSSASGHANGVK